MFYRSRIRFGMTVLCKNGGSSLGMHFFLTQRIRSLSQSKGTCLQRYVGTSTTLSDRVGGTSNASCKDKPAPPVTLNSIQGLYKFCLNVLQIPNQVQHDGSLSGRHFFLTQENRSLRLSKGTVCKRDDGPSTGIESSVTLN